MDTRVHGDFRYNDLRVRSYSRRVSSRDWWDRQSIGEILRNRPYILCCICTGLSHSPLSCRFFSMIPRLHGGVTAVVLSLIPFCGFAWLFDVLSRVFLFALSIERSRQSVRHQYCGLRVGAARCVLSYFADGRRAYGNAAHSHGRFWARCDTEVIARLTSRAVLGFLLVFGGFYWLGWKKCFSFEDLRSKSGTPSEIRRDYVATVISSGALDLIGGSWSTASGSPRLRRSRR